MYVYGGSGIDVGQLNFSDLWVFDFNLSSFKEITVAKSPAKPAGMYGHSLNYHQNAIYLFGGCNGFDYFRDLFRFDLASRIWE